VRRHVDSRLPIGLLGLVAPPLCLLCRSPLERGGGVELLCPGCAGELAMAPGARLRADGIDGGFAALPYRGAGRRLVGALKFSRLLAGAELGARLISARAPAGLLRGTLIPVPSAPLRATRRGIDPALELARSLAALDGLALGTPLRRRDLGHQRGRTRAQRLARPPRISVAGPVDGAALLIDDVVTTGATIDACSTALRAAGASRVTAVALAAVSPSARPLPGGWTRA
jgi:predicted amidophosphoribosyltransferase